MKPITIDDVIRYLDGEIDNPQELVEIEQARAADAQVARWFALLQDEDPEPSAEAVRVVRPIFEAVTQSYRDGDRQLGPDGSSRPTPLSPVSVSIGRSRGLNPVTTGSASLGEGVFELIEELGASLAAQPEGRLSAAATVMPLDALERDYGVLAAARRVEVHLAADSGQPRPRVQLRDPPYVLVANNKLYVGQRDEQMPFGVVRILASRDGVPIASVVRVMEFDSTNRTWLLEIPIAEIFGGDVVTDEVRYHVIPATKELRSLFPESKMKDLVAGIPAGWHEERQRLSRWFEIAGGDRGGNA